MNQKQVTTIVKGMCYSLPIYTMMAEEEVRTSSLSLKFCNRKGNLIQEGIKPVDLIKAISLFVGDEEYPDKVFIKSILESVISLIKVAERKKE